MRRVFFGLEVPFSVKQRLLAVQTDINGARWQGRHQLHLTLAFIGSVDDAGLETLRRAACRVTAPAFELRVQGLGVFGKPDHPRNLWAGISPEHPVIELHERLTDSLSGAGFAQEKRRFRPHITVSRFRRNAGSVASLLDAHGSTGFGAMAVTEFVLYESTPGAGGSVYTVLDRFPLTPSLDETDPSGQ
ncbi:RNA 2',3'-cyclic phosphodiesterase [Marinobacter koreensis]|uniref:RNA 2',3'-cyclic phosphodiesterase n=1 Tax=Marinobacter koreensis TaxID=335974 RepID=A0ABW0RMR5_9GAMM|nr:RNA 2',3'-cyclic phosphodiesterase [Marinobacter koreensis]